MDVETIAAGHRPEDASAMPDAYWESGPAGAAMGAVAAAVDGLLAVDLTASGTGATLDLLRGVEVQARRLYAMSVSVIGEMDRRGLAAPSGQLSTSSLVRQVINISRGDAVARVRLSGAISAGTGMSGAAVPAQLPLLAAAVSAGSIGPRHADLALSVFKSFDVSVPQDLRDSVEQFLVTEAASTDPVTFDNVCRRVVLAANPDGPEDEKDAHDKQEFHIGARRPSGLTKVWGLLDDVTVESLRAAFGAMCAPAAGRNKKDGPAPTDPTQEFEHPQVPGDPGADASGEDTGRDSDSRSDDDSDGIDRSGDIDGAIPGTDSVEGPLLDTFETGTDDQFGGNPADGPVADAPVDLDEPVDIEDPTEVGAGCDEGDLHSVKRAGVIENGLAATDVNAPPIWRSGRVPYEWAPLGTLPQDYPELEPRLFGDDSCPDTDPGRQQDPAGRPRAGTRRAQALGVIVSKFLDAGHAPIQGGEKPHLLVTVDERSLRERVGHGTLGYGAHISIHTVRMLACDSKVLPAVLGGKSELLDMGRSMRAFNAATARAILLRDKGCVFAGCDMPGLWTEKHHIQPWEEGGLSDYNNGCLLCRRHHTLVHHSDWTVRMASDGQPEVVPPATHDPARKPLRNTLNHAPEFDWPCPARP